MHTMPHAILLLVAATVCLPGCSRGTLQSPNMTTDPHNIPIRQLGLEYRLVGKLHVPLGKVVTITGVVVDGPYKGYEGGHNLRVQRIESRTIQEDIQIVIKPFFYKWGEEAIAGGNALPALMGGATYEMEGYTTGGFVGTPYEALRRGGFLVQTTEHYFREEFIVTKGKRIEPIAFAPDMFTGEQALIEGIAETRDGKAMMIGDGWSITIQNESPWPKDIEGKQIETWGKYQVGADHDSYQLIDGDWRLVRLEDQVGRDVRLQGTPFNLNGVWWFRYRGVDLYVEDLERLPGWTIGYHGQAIEIQGRLETAQLPRLDQISLKQDRDLKEYFIVRNARLKPIPALLSPERPFPTKW